MTSPSIHPCFLGPYGENDALLEKLVVEFLRDHVYWRRNFHPEDPPAISTAAAQHPEYLAFEARMRRELHQLSAALKKSVPFHSPRYIGHMASDLLLPGLAAQMLTLRTLQWPQMPSSGECGQRRMSSVATRAGRITSMPS